MTCSAPSSVDHCGTLRPMAEQELRKIASLLRERNVIDEKIAAVMHRPMTAGHLGEWIASQVFDIEPETSGAAIDGRFRAGPLQGRTVNVKWYLKREGLIDMTESPALDYYLILTGPSRQRCLHAVAAARGASRRSTCSTPSDCFTSSRPAGSRPA